LLRFIGLPGSGIDIGLAPGLTIQTEIQPEDSVSLTAGMPDIRRGV